MQDRMKEEFLHCCFHLFTLSKSKVFNYTIQYCTENVVIFPIPQLKARIFKLSSSLSKPFYWFAELCSATHALLMWAIKRHPNEILKPTRHRAQPFCNNTNYLQTLFSLSFHIAVRFTSFLMSSFDFDCSDYGCIRGVVTSTSFFKFYYYYYFMYFSL